MTTDEFLVKIKGPGNVVLPSGELSAAPKSIRESIGDALGKFLPKSNIIDGLELAKLKYEGNVWNGRVEWLLLLDTHLIHLKGTLVEAKGKRRLNVTYQLYPLALLVEVTVTTEHQETVGVHLYSAKLDVTFTPKGSASVSATFPEQNAEGVMNFAKSLLTASRR